MYYRLLTGFLHELKEAVKTWQVPFKMPVELNNELLYILFFKDYFYNLNSENP